ncbi:MAG: hypothetical protein IKZ65_03645 [Lachnospiraceae bacterium]|nr:hypothetical protein [Lachnospiraceae bacterium]
MNEFMKTEFCKNLPEDVKEKLKGCTGEEEVMDILKDNMIKLPDDALDEVAGGGCYGKCPSKSGDSREDIPSDKELAKDFEEGRITGADFFK